MNATVLLFVVAVALSAQAAIVYVARQLARRRCSDATCYGRDVGIEDAMSAVAGVLRERHWPAQQIGTLLDDSIDLMVAVRQSATVD